MATDIELKPEMLRDLYGDVIFVLESDSGEGESVSQETEPLSQETEPLSQETGTMKQEPEVVVPEVENESGSEEQEHVPPTGAIHWRPKPDSKVLFVLHQAEIRDTELAGLLKKIVQSIGIPFEAAGFGIIREGKPNRADFLGMPNPYAVVFDDSLAPEGQLHIESDGKDIFFTANLARLNDDQSAKRTLWEHLKTIKSKL